MTNERVKPQTPDLPQTHPGHDTAWASYWREKSRWQEEEIERLRDQRDTNLAKEVETVQRLNAEIEQLRADVSQAYDLRDKAEGRYCTALGEIERLRKVVAGKEDDCIRLHKQFMDAKYGPSAEPGACPRCAAIDARTEALKQFQTDRSLPNDDPEPASREACDRRPHDFVKLPGGIIATCTRCGRPEPVKSGAGE